MRQVERSALVPFSAGLMFDLVNDVARYPEFLPWCTGSEVLAESPHEMIARIEIGGVGFRQQFTTRNQLRRPDSMSLSLIDGPFRVLEGSWRFTQLGDAGCKVALSLQFEVKGGLMNLALEKLFDGAAERLVDAFCDRAMASYGVH
ncbi:MAG: type II toxin-antitoxin system RatA family toxin [Proteobacteria bacterium]|jgi:ribosome-associated toxin RatA of RatAB toxin-antitoxin module|nr:type II toxin-antitoxin system RatA family toxin [Pseudomonadota bacterium]MDA1299405.1 type II toxin-antitoxin system RatA family toxin [Pseudomonadota bacterium]